MDGKLSYLDPDCLQLPFTQQTENASLLSDSLLRQTDLDVLSSMAFPDLLSDDSKRKSPFEATTEKFSAVLTSVVKIGALLSLPVGIVPLYFYLSSEGAPFPLADASISILLSLISIAFLILCCILGSMFLLPAFGRMSKPSSSQLPVYSSQAKNEVPHSLPEKETSNA